MYSRIVTSLPTVLLAFTLSACGSDGISDPSAGGNDTVGAGGSGVGGAATGGSSSGTGAAAGAGGSALGGAGAGGVSTGGTSTGGTGLAGIGGAGDAGTGGASSAGAGGTPDGGAAGSGGASAGSGGGNAGDTVVRVHYPAGSHALTIRGASAGLSWTQGMTLSASGDVWSVTLSGLSMPMEWKPLLDDTTWALGPNYHVAPGETVDVYPHFTTMTGKVVTLISGFHSSVLSNDRDIYAYLPASYDENTSATFPVVYMHDGQNLWAAHPELAFGGTWNVDTAFDQASSAGTCSANGVVGWGAQPLGALAVTCTGDDDCPSGECRTFPEAIVIGVANNADRIHEYTPTTDPGTAGGGGADAYLQMIVTELKPAIDGMLRTRPEVSSTAMSGSSLGGLLTAYAGLKYPGVFGQVAEISPSSWWNNDVIVADVMTTLASPMRPSIVYVDSGEGTADDQADTDMLAAEYTKLGYVEGQNFRHVVQPGAIHAEMFWAERFPGAMQLVLGVR